MGINIPGFARGVITVASFLISLLTDGVLTTNSKLAFRIRVLSQIAKLVRVLLRALGSYQFRARVDVQHLSVESTSSARVSGSPYIARCQL